MPISPPTLRGPRFHPHSAPLSEGANNEAVEVQALQELLVQRGVAPGLAVDGVLGPQTAAALRRVQAQAGLLADGIAGPKTIKALTADSLADEFKDRRTPDKEIHRQIQTLWDKTWVLAVIIGLLAAEWILRKRARLV